MIRKIMFTIGVLAVGLAIIRQTERPGATCFVLSIISFAASLLASSLLRGSKRRAFFGFGIAGLLYTALYISNIGEFLPTTYAVHRICRSMIGPPATPLDPLDRHEIRLAHEAVENNYEQLGHALIAVVLALGGGAAFRPLFSRSDLGTPYGVPQPREGSIVQDFRYLVGPGNRDEPKPGRS